MIVYLMQTDYCGRVKKLMSYCPSLTLERGKTRADLPQGLNTTVTPLSFPHR